MKLAAFTRALLEQAVRLYLEEAYGEAPVPAPVAERLAWPPGEAAAVLGSDAFERTPPNAPPAACDRLALRLGNRTFPYMKLALSRVTDTADWVLVVDTHDTGVLGLARDTDRALLEALVTRNAELKGRIERRWGDAGLPTFERYIRDQLKAPETL
jgi:hypothetical protein